MEKNRYLYYWCREDIITLRRIQKIDGRDAFVCVEFIFCLDEMTDDRGVTFVKISMNTNPITSINARGTLDHVKELLGYQDEGETNVGNQKQE